MRSDIERRNAIAMRNAQAACDNATPPEDPPEPPSMDGEIQALMRGEDADLVTFAQFRECADDNLYDYMPEGVIELILACGNSTDPALVERTQAVREKLANLAGTMLDDAWHAAVERFKREGGEP